MQFTPTVTATTAVELPAIPLQTFSGDLLFLAVAFFVLAVIAGLMGARGVAGLSMDIARILVIVFLVLAVIALLF